MKQNKLLTLCSLLLVASVLLTACGGGAAKTDGFVIGVSNTLVGNAGASNDLLYQSEANASGIVIK